MGSSVRISVVIATAIGVLVLAFSLYQQHREDSDSEVIAVALDPADPDQEQIGQLSYLGGLDIPRMGLNIGGLSGLRWDAQSGRLLAITDDARFVWITPVEENRRLTGISAIEVGDLLGLEGERLTWKAAGDSESITLTESGAWAIGFERDHRIWFYDTLGEPARASEVDVEADFGPLEDNGGLEAMAGNAKVQLMCVERQAAPRPRPNCLRRAFGTGIADFNVNPPRDIAQLGGVPTDADALGDGTLFILFRSYSPSDGNGAAIVSYTLGRKRTEIATLRPPLTVDNFEGLALREEGGRVFLYIVSDDNFSSNQRTLLMKFEVMLASGE